MALLAEEESSRPGGRLAGWQQQEGAGRKNGPRMCLRNGMGYLMSRAGLLWGGS